jgi:fatty-acyl-CoA synthase
VRVPHAIRVAATSLWDNLAISARRFPDHIAIEFLGRSIRYAELARQVEVMAAHLAQLGVARGDRVLLDMQNCPQLVIAHFAILRANAVVVPINPMNRAEELKHYITDADARVAIVTSDLAADMARASNGLPSGSGLHTLIVTHYTDAFDPEKAPELPAAWGAWLLARPALPELNGAQVQDWATAMACRAQPPEHVVGSDDMALLPYTSGTTGHPKGCMHPHRTVMHNVMAGALWSVGSHENITLCVVPMFHITGIVVLMHGCIYQGAQMVLMPRWDRELAGQLISKHRVTHWTNIPTMVIDLLGSPHFDRFDLGSLQYIGGGGAGMPQAVAQRLLDLYGLKYVEGYGLTETAAPSHSNPPDRPKQQCLGVPYLSTDARVVDPETLKELPVGESGEIIISGPMVFDGYWKRPDATQAAFIEFEGRRYFRSGDMGRVDEDGYFFMTDRLKRMINASGFKVWPAEVESLMFRHPAIQEACVISARDDYRGETVKAVVVLRAGQEGKVSEQDIIDWCRDNMAVYKAPRIVEFAPTLPKSGSGKVMWRALQEAQNP